MDALMLNIYLNSTCSRQCPHCYYPQSNDRMTMRMGCEVAKWAVQLFRDEQVKSYKIHFLGGEPTLNTETLFTIMDIVNECKPEFTKSHPDGEYVLFTNGDFLNVGLMGTLKKWNVKIMLNPTQLSLNTLERKIEAVKKIMGGCSLAVVLDELNLNRLEDLFTLAVKHNCHVRTNRLYHGGTIPGYIDEYEKKMHKVFDILLSAEKPMWPNFIMESTYPTWEGPKNAHSCGRWLLVIDPDGSIRSCNADMDTKIGHIKTHKLMKDFKFSHRWSAKNLPECEGCEWSIGGLCQGGCPLSRKLTWGHYNKATPFCKAFKSLFPRLMELTMRWKEFHVE